MIDPLRTHVDHNLGAIHERRHVSQGSLNKAFSA